MSLEPNLLSVIFQIINFLVLAYLLNRFAFQPIMERAREHAAKRRALMEEIAQEQVEVTALRAELETRLAAAESESAVLVRAGKERAEEERVALLAEAQVEVERILAEAHADAARLRRESATEFHDELLAAILEVSSLIIGQVAPAEIHDALVDELNNRVWEMGRSEMARVTALRRALGDRAPIVIVQTAKPLSPVQQGKLVRTFTALADRNVNLDIDLVVELGLGLQARLGDLVLDNSISGKLAVLREGVSAALKERVTHE